MQSELLDELLRSKSFLSWSPDAPNEEASRPHKETFGLAGPFIYKGKTYKNLMVDEKHFSPADLAEAWGVSAETVRQIFRTEPGVLRLGSSGDRRTRGYVTLRIPQSVAVRVHARLTALPQIR
jgi:hypothetical protein